MTESDPAEFCERIRDRLVGSLTLYCGDRAVAEELAQEALARAWEQWSKVSQMASPEAWTFRTGTNLATSWFRRRAAEARANRRHAAGHADGGAMVDTHSADPPGAAAAAHAIRTEVSRLPPRQRAAIVARYYLGLDVAATADALGCTEGTVKAATHAAIAKLRGSGLVDEHEPEVERS